jgi:hypothetical protein
MPSIIAPVTHIRWFAELGLDDVPLVGGKNASLGELYRELSAQGVKVPTALPLLRRPIVGSCVRRGSTSRSNPYSRTSIRAIWQICASVVGRCGRQLWPLPCPLPWLRRLLPPMIA